VRLGQGSDGRIIGPSADGVLIERKVCPTCGARLERTPLSSWSTTGTRVSALPPAVAS